MSQTVASTNEKVSAIKGIGPKKIAQLKKLGIERYGDLIVHYPREYEDRSQVAMIGDLNEGQTVLVIGRVDLVVPGKNKYMRSRNLRILITDDSGSIEAVFFNAGYLEKSIKKDTTYGFFGNVTTNNGKLQLTHPDIMQNDQVHGSGILPVYPMTKGITQNEMRKWIRQAIDALGEQNEYLPMKTIERNRLCNINYALSNIHFPETHQKCKEAKYRLVFEELLLLQTGLLAFKRKTGEAGNGICFSREVKMEAFTDQLPFKLTDAQCRVIGEINNDMETSHVMNRLIQGDVGSGKTAVAAAAIYKAIKTGHQAVMMAPTELLAKQHLKTMNRLFANEKINAGFLSSGVKGAARKSLLEELRNGKIDLLIGTHALIEPGVEFHRLGVVITDEQHRFGVRQRALLTGKGERPDVLVMTATPIPRTLAVILYGDLDISLIDEMPPGRKEIITKAVTPGGRAAAYEFVRKQVKTGQQAYVVAPLIEDSESLDLKSATSLYEELKEKFSGFNMGLLYGSMKQTEKDAVMNCFIEGSIDILVSTVVIEVGIDVPNASVMLIENAERFGLAQMHQLRGRVGRGGNQSYCILISEADSGVAKERTTIMEETCDGFLIAEKDLKLRGPGDFFGTRQHGVPVLKIADLGRHIKILETVRREAVSILDADCHLSNPDNQGLRLHVEEMFSDIEKFSL